MHDRGYECVDPAMGDETWRLDDPALDPDRRAVLAAHLEVCDACRLRHAVGARVGRGLREGELRLGRPGRAWPRTLGLGGGALVAACLALMLVLPPQPRDGDRAERAAGGLRFVRPVEGEVVAPDRVRLRWEPVAGATGYRITVDQVGAPWRWRGETASLAVALPDSVALGRGRDFRARVQPVPADLAPLGGATVSFRTGDLGARLGHRLAAMPPSAAGLGLAGLALLAAAVVVRWRGRRIAVAG